MAARNPLANGKTGPKGALAVAGVDLVELAAQGKLDPCVGREAEIERCLSVLSRRTKNNPVLLGEPGVGKTAIVEGVAMRIHNGQVPPSLRTVKELWSISVGNLVAGTKLRGEFEERMIAMLAEIESRQQEIILFVDELHMLVGAGRSEGGNIDAANMLKPKLARGELRCIGATTPNEYANHIAGKDAAFERRWQPCKVDEPSEEAAVEMLKALRPFYEKHHEIKVGDEVLEMAVKESSRRVKDRYLPDKAVDVMDEACAAASAAGETAVTPQHAKAVVDSWAPMSEEGVHHQGEVRTGPQMGFSAGASAQPAAAGADSTMDEPGAAAASKLLEAMHQFLEASGRSKL